MKKNAYRALSMLLLAFLDGCSSSEVRTSSMW